MGDLQTQLAALNVGVPKVEAMFDEVDADNSGDLTEEEMKGLVAAMDKNRKFKSLLSCLRRKSEISTLMKVG